jgi:hypothetical protein
VTFVSNFPYLVQLSTTQTDFGHKTIDWLKERKKRPDRDYDIDMHGGHEPYVSFWFKDRKLAIYTKTVWG